MPHFMEKKVKGRKYLYIVWAKRINGRVKITKQLYLGNAKRVAELLEQPVPKFISYSYGAIAFLLHIAELVDFVSIFNKNLNNRRKKKTPADYLLLVIVNRLLKPRSKNGIKEWYEKTCLPFIWKKLSLSSQNYWYYLSKLKAEKINSIWKELLLSIKSKLKIEDNTFLFDPTNFFTYIDSREENQLLKKGHNKQKRNDKNQVALSIFLGEQSEIPYDFNTYAGNVHDSRHFEAIMPEFKEKVKLFSKEKITLVFDKGNNSKENFKAIKDYYFIATLPKEKKEVRDLLNKEFKYCYTNNNGNGISSVSKEAEVYGVRCKVVISFNEQLKKKQLHSLQNKITKSLQKFNGIGNSFKTEKAAFNALHEILPKKQNSFDYSVIKEGNKFKIILKLNEEKVKWYELIAGKNVYLTNHLEWSDERIIKDYRAMYKLENQFKILHGALLIPIPPIYHWTEKNIRAHIFLCMIALLFAKVLEYICRDETKSNFRKILDFASTIRIALVSRNNKPKLVFEELDIKQQSLIEAFSLSRFVKNY